MAESAHITILGGGPAGLAAAYFAKRAGIPFTLYEAQADMGGNCRTFRHGDFLYDSGAHRFHDVDPDVTSVVQELLGEDLRRVDAPSQIYLDGRFIDFPLSPLDLLRTLGPARVLKASADLAHARMCRRDAHPTFESEAVRRYGRTIAQQLLLDYSRKLWGVPCAELAPEAAGRRLRGLNVRAFLAEIFYGARAKVEHLDGVFFYPRLGYGSIADALAAAAGRESIRTHARIARIRHDGKRVNSVDGSAVDEVVSTLPVTTLLSALDPAPPRDVLELAQGLKFRHVVLVAFFLDQPAVTPNASIYFPSRDIPFTRVYEPRNRSTDMAPSGKTSLVAELPCSEGDELWREGDGPLVDRVAAALGRIGWVQAERVLATRVHRMSHAYPVLDLAFRARMERINEYLGGLRNLALAGRSASFGYVHLHDLVRSGKEIVERLVPA